MSPTSRILEPPDYGSKPLPAVGTAFVDPVFGSTIRRVTDCRAVGLPWCGTEYPTASCFSAGNKYLLVVAVDHFQLFTGEGTFIRDLRLAASSEPRWSRTDPDVCYFISGNQLRAFNVTNDRVALTREFPEYAAISGRGESDISADGDHMVFIGEDRHVFVYNLRTDTKMRTLDVTDQQVESLYLTSGNLALISWGDGGAAYSGITLHSAEMQYIRQVTTANGHKAICRDSDGSSVMVWTNSNERGADPGCPNGIEKIDLATGRSKCLLSLDWSLAVNISGGNGFAIISTYAPSNPQPGPDWKPYMGEIIKLPLDGSAPTRLAHHRSSATNYVTHPRGTVSRDGRRIVFGSDFGQPDTCDVYLISPEPEPVTIIRRGEEVVISGGRQRPIPGRIRRKG
jgi:WD40 repeat protein